MISLFFNPTSNHDHFSTIFFFIHPHSPIPLSSTLLITHPIPSHPPLTNLLIHPISSISPHPSHLVYLTSSTPSHPLLSSAPSYSPHLIHPTSFSPFHLLFSSPTPPHPPHLIHSSLIQPISSTLSHPPHLNHPISSTTSQSPHLIRPISFTPFHPSHLIHPSSSNLSHSPLSPIPSRLSFLSTLLPHSLQPPFSFHPFFSHPPFSPIVHFPTPRPLPPFFQLLLPTRSHNTINNHPPLQSLVVQIASVVATTAPAQANSDLKYPQQPHARRKT